MRAAVPRVFGEDDAVPPALVLETAHRAAVHQIGVAAAARVTGATRAGGPLVRVVVLSCLGGATETDNEERAECQSLGQRDGIAVSSRDRARLRELLA